MSKKTPWIIVSILAVVLIGGGAWYYKTKTASAAPSYMLGEVKRGVVAKKINATGTIQYPTQYNLTFDGKSRLTKVNVNVGDNVKAGQDLAEVDSADANQQVLTAKANLSKAQNALNQLKAPPTEVQLLSAQNAVADAQSALTAAQDAVDNPKPGQDPAELQSALDQAQRNYNLKKATLDQLNAGPSSSDLRNAQLNVQQAQAALASAQAALDQTKLVAPADGIITAVNGKIGEYPGSGGGSGSGSGSSGNNSPAFIVLDGASSNMQIVVPADEADIGSVKAGQSVDITLSAFSDKHFSGSVAQVAPTGTTTNNVTTFNVTISADNSENLMKAGMSANVAILVDQKQDVLMVPSEAVRGTGSNRTVLLPPAAGSKQPVSQIVQIGLDDGTNAEVISGLNEGQQVIIGFRAQRTQTTQGTSLFGGSNRGGMGGFGGFGGGGGGNRTGGGGNAGTGGGGNRND